VLPIPAAIGGGAGGDLFEGGEGGGISKRFAVLGGQANAEEKVGFVQKRKRSLFLGQNTITGLTGGGQGKRIQVAIDGSVLFRNIPPPVC